MKVMETLMKLFFYFVFYFPFIVLPEYILNLMIFWIRPIYRRLIKIEFWRNIIFKIGCLLASKITLAVFWFVENISCWLLEYIILCILTLYAYKHLFLDENKNFWFWFANPESFFQYHDGYFRKEKLLYRIYYQLGDKKKKNKFYDIF